MLLCQGAAAGTDGWMPQVLTDLWADVPVLRPLEAAILFIPLGLVFLLYGLRFYRLLVIVAYGLVGAVVGLLAGNAGGFHPLVGAVAGGLVLGLVAWPLHRWGWALLGGANFAYGLVVIGLMAGLEHPAWLVVLGLGGFVLGVVLLLRLFRPIIILVTSLTGAALLVQGVLRLAEVWPAVVGPVRGLLNQRPYLALILVLVLAGLGVALQWGTAAGAKPAKPEAEE